MKTILRKKHLQEMHPSYISQIKDFCRKAKRLEMQVEIIVEEDLNYLPSIFKMTSRTAKELRNIKEKERNNFVVPSYYLDLI